MIRTKPSLRPLFQAALLAGLASGLGGCVAAKHYDEARSVAQRLLREEPEAARSHLARWLGANNELLKV